MLVTGSWISDSRPPAFEDADTGCRTLRRPCGSGAVRKCRGPRHSHVRFRRFVRCQLRNRRSTAKSAGSGDAARDRSAPGKNRETFRICLHGKQIGSIRRAPTTDVSVGRMAYRVDVDPLPPTDRLRADRRNPNPQTAFRHWGISSWRPRTQWAQTPCRLGTRVAITNISLHGHSHVAEQAQVRPAIYPAIQAWLDGISAHPGHTGMV